MTENHTIVNKKSKKSIHLEQITIRAELLEKTMTDTMS